MHCEWIRRISFFRWYFGYLYIKISYDHSFWVGVWNILVVNLQIPAYLGSRMSPFFIPKFFLSVCKCCFIRICMFFLSLIFLVNHFWFLLALIGHCESLSLRFFCQTSATDTGRFWADGILFFSALAYFTNPALIIFHCPLSLHQIHSPPTIQFYRLYTLALLYKFTKSLPTYGFV